MLLSTSASSAVVTAPDESLSKHANTSFISSTSSGDAKVLRPTPFADTAAADDIGGRDERQQERRRTQGSRQRSSQFAARRSN